MSVPVTCDVFVVPPTSRGVGQALQRYLCLGQKPQEARSEGVSDVVTDADIIRKSIVEEVES